MNDKYAEIGERQSSQLLKTSTIGKVLFAPVGADMNDPSAWKVLDPASIEIEMEEPQPAQVHISDFSQHHVEYTMTAQKISRAGMKLVTGLLRLPGDKPLIHNGKKPR